MEILTERLRVPPIRVDQVVTISNIGKCVSFYLEMLRMAIADKRNGVKSHRVSMIDRYVEMLHACGVDVELG